MRYVGRKAKIGDLVEVKWLDAGTRTNIPLSQVKLFPAENIGYLEKTTRDMIVLRTGLYPQDGDIDATIIPRGCATEIKVLLRQKGN